MHVLGFLDAAEMAKVAKISDVWITKPGGSTTAELIQTQKQMLYIASPEHPWELANADYLEKLQLAGHFDDRSSVVGQIKRRLQIHQDLNLASLPKSDWEAQVEAILKHSDADKFGVHIKRTFKTKLEAKQLADIVRYIETVAARELQLGVFVLRQELTGLPCTLEHNPKTKHFYIHPEGDYEEVLGRGHWKKVTRSIVYTPENIQHSFPVAVLRLHEWRQIRGNVGEFTREVELLNTFSDAHYLTSALATTRVMTAFGEGVQVLQKIYALGSLGDMVKKKLVDSTKKVVLGMGMLSAFAELHERGYVHCDTHLYNFLVDESYKVALTDFGHTKQKASSTGVNAQHTREHVAPEALFFEKMQGEQYEKSDLFALGCCLFRLYSGQNLPWLNNPGVHALLMSSDFTNKLPVTERAAKVAYYSNALDQMLGPVRDELYSSKFKIGGLTEEEAFKYVILKLLHSDPQKRQSAKYWLKFMRLNSTTFKINQEIDALVNRLELLQVSEGAAPRTARPLLVAPRQIQPATSAQVSITVRF